MIAEELQQKIYDTFEQLDLIVPEFADAKARFNYSQDHKKVILALEKEKFEGSEAMRERMALSSQGYKDYLVKAFELDKAYYILEGRKNALERKLDALRTLLSFEKNQLERTQ